ncbi:MAG: Methionine aminopeptidase, partial [uncultured Rubrobacteraceae bacterium]
DSPQEQGRARGDAGGRRDHGRLPEDARPEREARRHHRRPRPDGRRLYPLPRRHPRVQGLPRRPRRPRLPRLHLRLPERHDRARRPRPLRAEGRRHPLHRCRRPPQGLRNRLGHHGRRRRGDRGHARPPGDHAGVPEGGHGRHAGREQARGRGARHTVRRRRGGLRGGPRPRLARGRAGDARRPPDPELRQEGDGVKAPAGDDVRDRAHDHARRLHDRPRREGQVVHLYRGPLPLRPLRAHGRRDGERTVGPHGERGFRRV